MSDVPREGEEDRGEIEEAEIDADEGLDETDPDTGESDEDDETEGQERDVDEPPARPSRRTNTVAALRKRAQEAERRADEAERRSQQPAAQPQRPDPAALAAEEAALFERWEQMAPREAERERKNYYERRFSGALNQVQGQLMDRMDQTSFQAAARNDPSMQRLAGKVEETIANLRAQGKYTINRDTVFTYLFGQEALQRRTPATNRQRREGQRRIAQQTTRPGSARSDAPRGRRPAADADEELLRNTTVGDL